MDRTFLSPRFHYTFGPHEPTLTIDPGDRLAIVCPDSDNAFADGSLLTPDQKQRPTDAPYFDGNPMAGPIYVRGAVAGDSLAVRIDRIELDRDYGQTGLAHGHGVLPPHLLTGGEVPRHLYRWRLDRAGGVATMENPLGPRAHRVPLRPFVGCIGTCPRWGQSVSTLEKGQHGGNMDLPLTVAGSVVRLPVQCDGALLMMGDVHAAQGHGEIIGGGIETSGVVHCTIDLIKARPTPSPRFEDDECLAATGVGGDVLTAIQQAYAHLIDWVTGDFGLNRWDAFNVISQCGSITLGNLSGAPIVVAASVPKSAIL